MDDPIYKLSDVAAAAGMKPEALQNWLARGVIKMDGGDVDSEGRGRHRLFTLRRALQVAVTAQLVRAGLKPAHAALVAFGWSDVSDGYNDHEKSPARGVGELYSEGLTVLAIHPNAPVGRIVRVDPAKGRAFDLFLSEEGRRVDTVTAHIINFTVENAKRRLLERV